MSPHPPDEPATNDPESTTATPFPIGWLMGALVFTMGVFLAMGWSAYASYRHTAAMQRHDLRLAELRGTIIHLDEVLTMSARMAAATGDWQSEQRYRQFETPLDDAVKETMRLTTLSGSSGAAAQTDEANLKLVAMENQAFALVRSGQAMDATKILFSDAYETQKKLYAAGMVTLIQDIAERLAVSQHDLGQRAVFFGATALLSVGTLGLFWLRALGRLKQWQAALGRAVSALRHSREELEKRVEERTARLAEASGQLTAMLENSPDLIYFKDLQSRFVCVSTALQQRYPDAAGQTLLGRTDFDIHPEAHAQECHADEQRILRTGVPLVGKLEQEISPDGRSAWVQTTKMPWRNGAGATIGTFGLSRDITALKEAEAKIAYERDQLRALLDASPDTIYFKDRQSRFVLVSQSKVQQTLERVPDIRARRAAGGLPADVPTSDLLTGLTDFDTYRDDAARLAFEDEQRIVRTGEAILGKRDRQVFLDGTVRWWLTSRMPWRDRAGNVLGTIGISKDITGLKETEEKLAGVHRQLVEASRQAGMAEVATGVLHNVGNVLNSVGVSATLVLEQVNESQAANLPRLGAMLQEHAGDLADFLTNDALGRSVPTYLLTLADEISAERKTMIAELEHLRKNIDHIKDVVAMHQNYGQVSGVVETIALAGLVEDTLRMNASALVRHGVEVVRDYQAEPTLAVDRHKVVQILVNLIQNAKFACVDSGRADKQVTVRITRGVDRVCVVVSDNGIGIPPENLTRIFNHGFTTRQGGHGFGLHNGALAARELGGALNVQSGGPGQGAAFTLELPCVDHPAEDQTTTGAENE